MKTVYHMEPYSGVCLYFAGPTWLAEGEVNWHEIGIAHLRERNFSGTVILPMPRDGNWRGDDAAQIAWQLKAQQRATVIVFWMPRMGPVTNIEFGEWCRSGKIVLGSPPGTPKTDYALQRARTLGVPIGTTLSGTIDLALARL